MHRYVKIKSHVTNENLNVDTSDNDSSNDESGDDVKLDDINVDNMEVGDQDANVNVDHVDIFNLKTWDNISSDMIKVLMAEDSKRDKSINKGNRLKEHGVSLEHLNNMANWFEMRRRLKKNETIDKLEQKQFENERDHLKNGLIEMLEVFDPFIKEHVRRITSEEIHVHYSCHNIQNELIQLLEREIRSTIIKRIKQVKYFSLILDCTPNTSHQEQMSLILRYVNISSTCVSVEESFSGFLNVDDTTGQELFDLTQAELKALDLDIDDSQSKSLATNELGDFEFIVAVVIWFDISHKEFRVNGFSNAVNVAKKIALEMDINPLFIKKCGIRRKRHFHEAFVEEDVMLSAEESLKSSMSQERLNGLALIAIENDMLESVDYEDLINNSASENAIRNTLFK
nr:zinc finger MYM-type protein 1-like [Tanacetum cinerariifolium]